MIDVHQPVFKTTSALVSQFADMGIGWETAKHCAQLCVERQRATYLKATSRFKGQTDAATKAKDLAAFDQALLIIKKL